MEEKGGIPAGQDFARAITPTFSLKECRLVCRKEKEKNIWEHVISTVATGYELFTESIRSQARKLRKKNSLIYSPSVCECRLWKEMSDKELSPS